MFALAIRYLNGWAMAAADGARKEQAEWPLHPDRVFMAMAAAWFETGADPVEGDALRWLETLSPPALAASEAGFRQTVTSYVPVNDTGVSREVPGSHALDKLKDAGLAVLPEHRLRNERHFPVAIPHDPVVHLIWDADLAQHREGLERLAEKVTHIGHSASLVQMWVSDEGVPATWLPTNGVPKLRLRVPTAGRLQALAEDVNRAEVLEYARLRARVDQSSGKEKKRMKQIIDERFGERVPVSLRPRSGLWHGYTRRPDDLLPAPAGTVFQPHLLVFTLRGRAFTLPSTLRLLESFRGSLMAHCRRQPPPEWFSGHRPDGAPSEQPHMALLPLSFSGFPHADGRIMGLAIALPEGLDPAEAGNCLEDYLIDAQTGLPREHKLYNGRWFECDIALQIAEIPPKSLTPDTWTQPSKLWASVTPIVLDRHFKGAAQWELAAENIKDACERIGLPRPREVILNGVAMHEGVPHARQFPALRRKSDGGYRYHTHALLLFDQEVQGPVLVGAGRFRGYGLCRPLSEKGFGDV